MKLIAVLQGPARLMRNQTLRRLESGGMVIGPAPTSDWVINDPERVISSSHCRIAAIASRDRARAEAAAERLGIPRSFGSYEALLEDPGAALNLQEWPRA